MKQTYPIIQQKDFLMEELAALIDYSVLVPNASFQDVTRFLKEIKAYGFKIACVNNNYTELAAKTLQGTDIKVATVVAFPFGALTAEAKAAEIESSIKLGADAVDVVAHVSAIKSADWELSYRDMSVAAETAHKLGAPVKIIFDCWYLTDEEIVKACEIAMKAGVDFVKTSTGFAAGVTTDYDLLMAKTRGWVRLMKETVGENFGVKAAGPVGDYQTAVDLIHLGAHRVGSRRGLDILRGCSDWEEREI